MSQPSPPGNIVQLQPPVDHVVFTRRTHRHRSAGRPSAHRRAVQRACSAHSRDPTTCHARARSSKPAAICHRWPTTADPPWNENDPLLMLHIANHGCCCRRCSCRRCCTMTVFHSCRPCTRPPPRGDWLPQRRLRLASIQGWRCAICDVMLGPAFHVDHVIPYSISFDHSDKNLQVTCVPCHLTKTSEEQSFRKRDTF